MTRNKWTTQQEAELKALIEANTPITEMSAKLQKTPGAIIVKSQRLGLTINTKGFVNTSIPLPRKLLSVEETLQILAGSLKGAVKPGLDKVEVQRLQAVATISKIYKELLADYINYREIEFKLKEAMQENAELSRKLGKDYSGKTSQQKGSDDASRPDST